MEEEFTDQNNLSRHDGLKWLLYPLLPDLFVSEYWQLKPYMVRDRACDYLKGLCTLHSLKVPCRPLANGSDCSIRTANYHHVAEDVANPSTQFADGGTLIFDNIERYLEPVYEVCKAVEYELHALVMVDAHFAPPQSQTGGVDRNTFDLMVLQLDGVTRWDIWKPHSRYPLAPRSTRLKRDMPRPDFSFELTPGNLLYVPRGYESVVRTDIPSSLHLRMKMQVTTWLDLVCSAAQALAERQLVLRRALPPRFLDIDEMPQDMDNTWKGVFDLLSKNAVWKDTRANLGRRLLQSQWTEPPTCASLLSGLKINGRTQLKKRPHVITFKEVDPQLITLYLTGNAAQFPSQLLPAIEFVLGANLFTPSEIPGLESAGQLMLARKLIDVGLLECPVEVPQ